MDIFGMGETRGIRTTHNVLSGFLFQGHESLELNHSTVPIVANFATQAHKI